MGELIGCLAKLFFDGMVAAEDREGCRGSPGPIDGKVAADLALARHADSIPLSENRAGA